MLDVLVGHGEIVLSSMAMSAWFPTSIEPRSSSSMNHLFAAVASHAVSARVSVCPALMTSPFRFLPVIIV